MIIELDNSFEEADLTANQLARDAIEAAGTAAVRGQHYFIAKREILRRLAESDSLSLTVRGLCREVLAQYSFLAALVRRLKYRIRISLTAMVVERQNQTEWLVPARQIAENGIRPAILLAENSRDAEIYVHAGFHYRIAETLSDVQIHIEPRNGNGAGTPEELRRIGQRAAEWCICVTDSDLECPDGALGHTTMACGRIVNDHPHSILHHISTEGRELENTVPTTLLEEVAEQLHAKEIGEFRVCQRDLGADAMRFADLKRGMSLCRIMRLALNAPPRLYWTERLQVVPGAASCIESARCQAEGDPKCGFFGGFGDQIAVRLQEHLDSQSSHRTFKSAKSAANFDEWLRIGEEVLHAGAAPKPLRI